MSHDPNVCLKAVDKTKLSLKDRAFRYPDARSESSGRAHRRAKDFSPRPHATANRELRIDRHDALQPRALLSSATTV